MADDNTIANGVGLENDDSTTEIFYEPDQRENETKMKVKVDALEQEKLSLISENEDIKAQIVQFKAEIESLRSESSKLKLTLGEMERENEESKKNLKALDVIAHRAQQLESEVVRLQHDLISAMSAGEESNSEISEMKKLLGEKELSLEELRREKVEEENKIRDLEKKIGALEVKEVEERSKKVRMEEEMLEKLDEKEKEMGEYKKKLQASEEKLSEMEGKVLEMQKKVEEAEISIGGLKERSMDAVNGFEGEKSIGKGTEGLKVGMPVLAVGLTGAFLATAAVVYIHYARRS
ncbi:peroxisomal and mitochondrial division factor 2-like [Euphorbia lathyris]|uniref:peroxisomal and mitochondrial division factor 2-like n=1 Tax=Euphorbia lathyris TaxID=212925 RepID=UPI003314089F